MLTCLVVAGIVSLGTIVLFVVTTVILMIVDYRDEQKMRRLIR